MLLLFFGAGWWFGHYSRSLNNKAIVAQPAKMPLYWIDTMEPNIHYPGPGKSRMGMELVPVYADVQKDPASQPITISPAVQNNLGIRLASVKRGNLSRLIKTVGYVTPNENTISHIHPYEDGWIRGMPIKIVGTYVKKGDLLFQLYSPNLISIEEEYLLALRNKDLNIIKASRHKLLAFNISEQQVQTITKNRKADPFITVYAPQDGFIMELNVREGMRVTPNTEVMVLVDLSAIWIMADVFEGQAAWIQKGQSATATLDAFPGKTWEGRVEHVYPVVDPTTRTTKVRLGFPNAEFALKPNMYAHITLAVDPQVNVLTIPREAIIPGDETNHVIVSLGNGHFEPRSIKLGIESGDRVEILSGLTDSEKVVISGQFLLDSEANLKMGLQRLNSKDDKPHGHHHH